MFAFVQAIEEPGDKFHALCIVFCVEGSFDDFLNQLKSRWNSFLIIIGWWKSCSELLRICIIGEALIWITVQCSVSTLLSCGHRLGHCDSITFVTMPYALIPLLRRNDDYNECF